MKKLLTTAALLVISTIAFCQQEENGTIYIKHPYIDVVNNAAKAYMAKDEATEKTIYADTARVWISGLEKGISIADAIKGWSGDFDYFDDINLKTFGYPDYLHYKKDDGMTVQSWWTLSGKSKKTGEVIKIPIVIFDDFNTAGKIISVSIFGDLSKWFKEKS